MVLEHHIHALNVIASPVRAAESVRVIPAVAERMVPTGQWLIRRRGVWPYCTRTFWDGGMESETDAPWESWDADTLFDVVEVLHDNTASQKEVRRRITHGPCFVPVDTFVAKCLLEVASLAQLFEGRNE